jgi:hypothetical protein
MKVGSILQETNFFKVKEVHTDHYIVESNKRDVRISKEYLENNTISADDYNSEKKQTKTEINAVIAKNENTVMSICFEKQIDTNKVRTELKKGNTTTALDLLTPEERIMKGVHYGLDEHGRYKFLDMEINEMRVVDPRTIKYLILKNTKYLIK